MTTKIAKTSDELLDILLEKDPRLRGARIGVLSEPT